jgi:hypothetical protein
MGSPSLKVIVYPQQNRKEAQMKLNLKHKLGMAGALSAGALMLVAAAPVAAIDAQSWTWDATRESDLVRVITYRAMPSPSPDKLTGHQIEFESMSRPGVKGAAHLFCKPSLGNCTGADFAPGAILAAQPPRAQFRAGNFVPDFTVACIRDARGRVTNCSALGGLIPGNGQ